MGEASIRCRLDLEGKVGNLGRPFGRLMEGHLATIKAVSSLCDRRLLIVLSPAAPARRLFAFVLPAFSVSRALRSTLGRR